MTAFLNTAAGVSALIEARIAGISIANGYETDVGLRKFLGKRAVDDSEAPCSVLIEGADDPTDSPGRKPTVLMSQRYVLGGYDLCDPDNPNTKAHAMIRDFKRAIFKPEDATFGGKVKHVYYRGRDIGPRLDGKAIVFALIEIDVEYVEDLSNP